MNRNLGRRAGAGLLIAIMNINVVQVAWSNSLPGKGMMTYPQLMQDVEQIDSFGAKFNSDTKNKDRVANLLTSFEKILNRPLDNAERQFLSLEFATIDVLPRFEIKDKTIQIYDNSEGSKDLLLSIEIVDIEKSIFKFGERTFKLDPSKPIHENVQLILKELQKGEKVSFWQQFNPLASAHAEMAPWVKILLIAGVALAVGIFVGIAINKNKAKKDTQLAGKKESSNDDDCGDSCSSGHGDAPTADESEAIPAISEPAPALV